jgi:hypothetical protein
MRVNGGQRVPLQTAHRSSKGREEEEDKQLRSDEAVKPFGTDYTEEEIAAGCQFKQIEAI